MVNTVCAEFLSDCPTEEAPWIQGLSSESGHPGGVIALADFMSPDIAAVVNNYASMASVRAVRQHFAWHPSNPLLRSTTALRNPLLRSTTALRKGVALLSEYNLCCEIEVFAHQLADFGALANSCPDVQFVLPAMGCPLDLTPAGYQSWKSDMAALSRL